MKKNHWLFLLFIFVVSGTSMAQPVLTAAATNPITGDVFHIVSSVYSGTVSPSGANVVWNFSSLAASGNYTRGEVMPASTPYSSVFPLATLCDTIGSNFDYYLTNSSSFLSLGRKSLSNNSTIYSNSMTLMIYPFTYGSSFTDSFAGIQTIGPSVYNQSGIVTTTAESWGTVTTPTATFYNALRVRQNIHYVQTIGATTYQTFSGSAYFWYVAGVHQPVLSILSDTVNGSPVAMCQYLSGAVGISEENEMGITTNLFPNPATNSITLEYVLKTANSIEISIVNSLGEKIISKRMATQPVGEYSEIFNLQGISKGIYFAEVTAGNSTSRKRFVKQ